MRRLLGLLSLALLACGASLAQAAVLHVPGDYSTIYAAVQACPAGDTVQVAAGTYNDCTHETEGPGSTPACVIMKSGVTLRGAGKDATIIDAQGLGRGIYVAAVSDVRIENLQVRGAYAALFGAGILFYGGALSNVEASDLTVTANGDGGIILYLGASAVLRRIDFLNNTGKRGAGLSVEDGADVACYDSNFSGNSCPFGGGILVMGEASTALIDGCVLDGNDSNGANNFGGGILVSGAAATITNCEIRNNTANGSGGGVAFAGGASGGMSNCLITGNQAMHTYGAGGGIHVDGSAPLFEYLVIADNQASGFWAEGGGVNVNYSPAPTFRHCTIFGNSVGANPEVYGGNIACQFSGDAVFDKCIIAESPQGQGIYCLSASPTFTCCDVWGNVGGDALCGVDGGGNFSLDPVFCVQVGAREEAIGAIAASSPCMPGNHPDGPAACDGDLIGAVESGCETGVGELPLAAARLLGNAPNPFNPKTTVFFVLDAPGVASIRIHDLAGRRIATLPLGALPAGSHQVVWDGRDDQGKLAASGVYFYSLDALGETQSRRMTLVK
jgi:hypothetical protein